MSSEIRKKMSSKKKVAHDINKKWRSDDIRIREQADFSVMLLKEPVIKGLAKAGFKIPSPIQLEAIPAGKFGRDLIVQAKSGTGKTLVFTVIALENLKPKLFRPQVLILAPTREIATQICSVVQAVGSAFRKLTCCSFIGGLSVAEDIEHGRSCQIAVGTPGRVRQLIKIGSLPANSIRLFVLDEADQLLCGSFKSEIDDIFKHLPSDKQVIATSATYPDRLKKIFLRYMKNPGISRLNATDPALLGIVNYIKVVSGSLMPLLEYQNKLDAVVEILNSIKFGQCLLFCNMVSRVDTLVRDIRDFGFSVSGISSSKDQEERLKVMDRFKHFRSKVLVSSDLSSRGIDAENVDVVINFDLANTIETYLHRSGRAGRYGSVGLAISVLTEKQLTDLEKLENLSQFKCYKLPEPIPSDLVHNPILGELALKFELPKTDVDVPKNEDEETFTANDNEVETSELLSRDKASKDDVAEVMSFEDQIKNSTEYHDYSYESVAESLSVENLYDNGDRILFLDDLEISDDSDTESDSDTGCDSDTECDSETEKSSDSYIVASTKENVSLHLTHGNTESIDDELLSAEHSDFNLEIEKNISKASVDEVVSVQNLNKKTNSLMEDTLHSTLENEKNINNSELTGVFLDSENCSLILNCEKEDDFSQNLDTNSNNEEFNRKKEDVCSDEVNKLTIAIKNYIFKYENASPIEHKIKSDTLSKSLQNGSLNGSCISLDEINNLQSKKRDYFYRVLKSYQDDIEGSSALIVNKNIEQNIENCTQINDDENVCASEVILRTDLKESSKPNSLTTSIKTTGLKVTQPEVISSLPQSNGLNDSLDSSACKLKNIDSVNKPKHHSTPSSNSKCVFETSNSSEDSEPDSESDSEYELVSNISESSSEYSSTNSESESDSSPDICKNKEESEFKRNAKVSFKVDESLKKQCHTSSGSFSPKCHYQHCNLDNSLGKNEEEKEFRRNTNLMTRANEVFKEQNHACTASSCQKYDYQHSRHLHQSNCSETPPQRRSGNHSNRGMISDEPRLHFAQNTPNYFSSSEQRKSSKRGRYPVSHCQGPANMYSTHATQSNAANLCDSCFARNSSSYFVPSPRNFTPHFSNKSCCGSQSHENHLKPSHYHHTSCYSNEARCCNTKRVDHPTGTRCSTPPMERHPYSLQCGQEATSCSVHVGSNRRNHCQMCSNNASCGVPRSLPVFQDTRNIASCSVPAGCDCQTHNDCCHCYSHLDASCSAVKNFDEIFHDQWRFLQRYLYPYP